MRPDAVARMTGARLVVDDAIHASEPIDQVVVRAACCWTYRNNAALLRRNSLP